MTQKTRIESPEIEALIYGNEYMSESSLQVTGENRNHQTPVQDS